MRHHFWPKISIIVRQKVGPHSDTQFCAPYQRWSGREEHSATSQTSLNCSAEALRRELSKRNERQENTTEKSTPETSLRDKICAVCFEDCVADMRVPWQSWPYENALVSLETAPKALFTLWPDWNAALWALLYVTPVIKVQRHVLILQTAGW